MNRSIQILSFFFVLTFVATVSAQTFSKCSIEVDGPSEIDSGTLLVYKVKVTGDLPTSTPEFKWYVSAGTIMKGEGTEGITIDTVGLGGQTVTVTAELIGAPPGCNNVASKTTSVKEDPVTCGLPFDRYGNIRFIDEQARLDNFAIQIANEPASKGLILISAGQETYKGEAAYHLNRAKSYLVGFRGVDSKRIIAVDCGFTRELSTTLWIVLPGVTLPDCNSWDQIPLSEVKFTKPLRGA